LKQALHCWKLCDRTGGWSWHHCPATSFSLAEVVVVPFQIFSFLEGMCGIMAPIPCIGNVVVVPPPQWKVSKLLLLTLMARVFQKTINLQVVTAKNNVASRRKHCVLLEIVWEMLFVHHLLQWWMKYININQPMGGWENRVNMRKFPKDCLLPQLCEVPATFDCIQRHRVAPSWHKNNQHFGSRVEVHKLLFIYLFYSFYVFF